MSGLQEILLLIVLVLVVFLLPRRLGRAPEGKGDHALVALSGRMRLYLVASVLWPALVAMVLRPWEGPVLSFLCWGPGPVALAWAAGWVVAGYRAREK